MHKPFAFALLAAAALSATAAPAPAAPAPIEFDGQSYAFSTRDAGPNRRADHFLRADEDPQRFSRMLTVAELIGTAGARSVALGVVQLAKLRTPGIDPETFAAEGTEAHDATVVWYVLTDDNAAVEFHAARFVDLPGGGVREYHFVVRRYTNGAAPDAMLMALRGTTTKHAMQWVEALSLLDRAPSPAPGGDPR